ncbi:MAG: kynureninase, partial [Flavisolibacter sp.]
LSEGGKPQTQTYQATMTFQNTLDFSRHVDASDPLKHFRNRFHIPKENGKEVIYFTGNSLGLQPKSVKQYINQELEDWAELGVEGHFKAKTPWFSYHEIFPALLSKIVGALPEEVVVMNQLTINLHLLLTTFYRPTKERYRIICEAKAFPSDQYAFESQVRLHGFNPEDAIIEVSPREGKQQISHEDIIDTIERYGNETAVVIFGGVNYYNGQVFDMKVITEAAHKVGAYAGFDLAHAVGNISLELHDWNADFACWCSYKYLNSGPGGVAGVFIHQRHAGNTSLPRLAGWWGNEKDSRFQMKQGFQPIATAEGWQVSNAPVLSMAAHKASLDIFEEAGMDELIKKSKLLTGYLFYIIEEINRETKEFEIDIITPANENEHGCQVSMLVQKQGKQLFESLLKNNIVADWREPNVIRVAPVPLYNRFEDVWHFGNTISKLFKT